MPQYKYVIVNNTLNEVLISNLESDTEYQLSISARNRLGESLMSRDTLTVKTLPDVSKRKLESVLASADEQKLGYNKQKITEEMIEISVITSILVFFLLCLTSIVICCVRRQRRAQVHQKAAQKARNSNNSKEILLNSTTEERPFTISGSTTLDSECTVDTTVLEQHHNTDKCLYVEKRGNLLSNFAPNYWFYEKWKTLINFVANTETSFFLFCQKLSIALISTECLSITFTRVSPTFSLLNR